MDFVGVIEVGHGVGELCEYLVVACHVGGEDAAYNALADRAKGGRVEGRQYVALGRLEDAKRHRAVVILEGRDVVIAQRQLRASVYLIDVVVARVVEVVADARDDQHEHLEFADLRHQVHGPHHRVHLANFKIKSALMYEIFVVVDIVII